MRPLRLELEGFSTFRERTVLDFTDLDLVALTGNTGAGKSTVIDAMTFALYGSVPRYGNAGVVEPVIHQLASEAKVRFDFEIGGQRHIATRVTRRQQRSGNQGRSRRATTKEARLERVVAPSSNQTSEGAGDGSDGADIGETEVLAGSVTELDAAVVSLLGLTFNQFTRTVVLPQGEFANFLRDEPLKRQELLKRLLDLEIYSRMGSEARKRAEASDQQVKTLEHELARLDVPDDDRLAVFEQRLSVLATLGHEVEQWLVQLGGLDQALEPLRGQVSQMQNDIDALESVAVPDDLERQAEVLKEAEQRSEEADGHAKQARRQADELRSSAADLGDRAELIEHRQKLVQIEEAQQRLKALESVRLTLTQQATSAAKDRADAEGRQADLGQQVAAAREVHDVSHLIDDLSVGDQCPVCQQTVDELPDLAATGTDTGKSPIVGLEASLVEATTATQQAMADEAAVKAELKSIESQQAEWEQRATVDTPAAGSVKIADIEKTLESLDAVLAEERELSEAVAVSEKALSEARAEVDEIRTRQSSGRQLFGRQRDSVAHLGPPEATFDSLYTDWLSLADWARQHRTDVASQRSDLVAEGKAKRSERDKVAQALLAATSEVGLSIDLTAITKAAQTVSVAEADTRAEHQRALDAQAHGKRLQDDIVERGQSRELNRELGRHLSAKGFEAWLLAEAFDDITGRATTRLLELSAGRYSLAALEREIAIVDHHNANEQRPARTLSGGETFLASLALALALADSIADLAPVDAPRLESMFLDEGFGTLDADTLDVVAEAIEELAASGRMIGIVTHVRDLAERMPARFEIKKLPGGSSAELITL